MLIFSLSPQKLWSRQHPFAPPSWRFHFHFCLRLVIADAIRSRNSRSGGILQGLLMSSPTTSQPSTSPKKPLKTWAVIWDSLLSRCELRSCKLGIESHTHTCASQETLSGVECVCCCCSATKSRLTLCDPVDYSPPVSSVHGVLQARILEWVTISFSRGFSWPRDWTHVSCTGRWILYQWATMKTYNTF